MDSYNLTIIWLIVVFYFVTVLGVVGTVLSENRNPLKASAWVLIVVFIPLIGLLAYVLFGQDQRRLYRLSKRFYRRLMRAPYQLSVPRYLTTTETMLEDKHKLISLLEHSGDAPLLELRSSEIFAWGEQMYARMFEDIRQAEEHIHLQAYIFDADDLFDRLEALLIERAEAGVEVRIIYDFLGSYDVPEARWKQMKAHGIQIYPFMRVAIPLLSSTVNYRNHRKVAVIDGRIGYVGGMNFAQRYLTGNHLGKWRDTHFRLEGAAVGALQSAFLLDWYSVSRRVLNMERYYGHYESLSLQPHRCIQLVLGGPISKWPTIEQAFISMIHHAREQIRIQTPYFLPTDGLNSALITAALSGIRVELMLPIRTDSRAATYATASYLADLLEAGVRIYQYEGGFLHSKLMMVDGEISAIGSANMDFRSLEHNFEITGIAYDRQLTLELEQLFEQDKQSCRVLDREVWASRGARRKVQESVMRLFAPLL